MANMHLIMKARWWVIPFMYLCKVAVYSRLLRERHFQSVVNFIAEHGYKITSR